MARLSSAPGDSSRRSSAAFGDVAPRRPSGIHNSRRQSLMAVAKQTAARPTATKEPAPPILAANFEQWMKLVKDNKINATNSWNFALIDYFYDMSLLKEGDGINFQRASYTLDGCIKIYTSRVDSVASETGKLLSGLAESSKGKQMEVDPDDDGEADGDEPEDGDHENGDDDKDEDGKLKGRRKRRAAESTLASSFTQLRAKKYDLELAIDPLFRKMCADFDEGGAKGLLLNSLYTDRTGRVVFDGQADDEEEQQGRDENENQAENIAGAVKDAIDLQSLRIRYLPNLDDLANMTLCPSIDSVYAALDPNMQSAGDLEEELADRTSRSMFSLEEPLGDAGMDDEGYYDGDDGPGEEFLAGIDEDLPFGGASAVAAGLGGSGGPGGGPANPSTGGGFALGGMSRDQDILNYFDETLRRTWAGPEHWKVQKLKASSLAIGADSTSAEGVAALRKRRPREEFFIDFMDDEAAVDEQMIFTAGANLTLPRAQWTSNTRNMLPDDKHFSSKNLIRLFTKPKGSIVKLLGGDSSDASVGGDEADTLPDEAFWANQYNAQTQCLGEVNDDNGDGDVFGDYGDYGDGELDMSPTATRGGDFADSLVAASRAKPEYVSYARTAKRVDVKLLKDNIWNILTQRATEPEPQPQPQQERLTGVHTFADTVSQLNQVYSGKQLGELSTSFCFICVLHLANEQGLEIKGNDNYSDLTISEDPAAH